MEYRLAFYGTHTRAFHDAAMQLDIEGAVRSGKTTLCLAKVLALCLQHPGIAGLICRFSDGDTSSVLKPIWRQICLDAGVPLTWNAEEHYDELPNGSRVYIKGLKTQDQTNRYGKFRGLTLAFVYVDQAEELPHDVYQELVLRLSQKGFPHQLILSPQTVARTSWIAKEFPHDTPLKPGRSYYALSTRDNAHNLEPGWVELQEENHPPGTPIHSTLLLGKRGAVVVGDPVYGTPANGSRVGAFVRVRHVTRVTYNAKLGLEVALDFGKHHPCLVARQVSESGQIRYLGGVLGFDIGLDAFLTEGQRLLASWFPAPSSVAWCCDPAGINNPIGVDMGAILREHGISARAVDSSNTPTIRLGCIEHITKRLRERDLIGNEAVQVSNEPEHWRLLTAHGSHAEEFVADAFEFGYVWDEHTVSVANKPVRRPKKDGWWEHGMNCVEYLEANFGGAQAPKGPAFVLDVPKLVGGPMSWAG